MKRGYFLMSCDLQDDAEVSEVAFDFEELSEMECVDYIAYDKKDDSHVNCYIAK
mgnify:CR=1 FL=1